MPLLRPQFEPQNEMNLKAVQPFPKLSLETISCPPCFSQGQEARFSTQERVPFALVGACEEQVQTGLLEKVADLFAAPPTPYILETPKNSEQFKFQEFLGVSIRRVQMHIGRI